MKTAAERARFLQTFSFWEAARRDPVMLGSLFSIMALAFLQAGFLAMILWSRIHFGSRFDEKIFSDYQLIQSNQSVNNVLKLEEAQKARDRARVAVHDDVSVMLDRADQEMDLQRARAKESQIVDNQMEKQAQNAIQLANIAWDGGKKEEAIKTLQSAAQSASDYLPLSRALALRLEDHGDMSQSKFQWEKVQGIALPGSPEMKEAAEHLEKLSKAAPAYDRGNTTSPIASNRAISPLLPQTIKILEVKQNDLTLQENDLRFNLRFLLETRSDGSSIDIAKTRLEVVFYDQSMSAAGLMVPIKILTSTLQPRQAWPAGSRQILSLNYTVPKGYFRRKTELLGESYRFCGFIARLFYRDQLQDAYAQPKDLLEGIK